MNSKKYFIVGRRYYNNDGSDTLLAMSERYTRSGYRYLRMKSDKDGGSWEYKVHVKDGEEYIDLFGGGVKNPSLDDNSIIRSSMETEYIIINEEETRFLAGEEIELSVDKLARFLEKLPITKAATIMVKLNA